MGQAAILGLNGFLLFVNLLFLIAPADVLIRNPSVFPQGLATLFGGIIGLSAIAWQTKKGFDNLIASQNHRAEIEREGRADDARLKAAAKRSADLYEKQTLAASLQAELSSLFVQVGNARNYYIMNAAVTEELAKLDPNKQVESTLMALNTPIFEKSIDKIGILGVSTAGDVVKVYGIARVNPLPTEQRRPVNAKMLAGFYHALAEAYRDLQLDISFVSQRLLAAMGSGEDPGPLFFEQQRRKGGGASATSTSQNGKQSETSTRSSSFPAAPTA